MCYDRVKFYRGCGLQKVGVNPSSVERDDGVTQLSSTDSMELLPGVRQLLELHCCSVVPVSLLGCRIAFISVENCFPCVWSTSPLLRPRLVVLATRRYVDVFLFPQSSCSLMPVCCVGSSKWWIFHRGLSDGEGEPDADSSSRLERVRGEEGGRR